MRMGKCIFLKRVKDNSRQSCVSSWSSAVRKSHFNRPDSSNTDILGHSKFCSAATKTALEDF